MEADTPRRYEKEEEIEMKERESEQGKEYLRPIDWYNQRESHKTYLERGRKKIQI